MTGAWFFRQEAHTGNLLAIEPDGTEHHVQGGDLRTTAGLRLLNAMVKALTAPSAPPAPQPSTDTP